VRATIIDDEPVIKDLRAVILLNGSLGDIIPIINFADILITLYQEITIITHVNYKEWVESRGYKFLPVNMTSN